MRAVIFLNGEVNDYTALARWLQPGDRLLCADGGTRHCLALGLTPDVVVGDLDSADPAVIADLMAQGVAVERHPVAKDQTDLELALERAFRDGAQEAILLGALGGRLDQTLANLLILAQRRWPGPVRIAEGAQIAQIIYGGDTLTLDLPAGSTVSAIPFSPQVTGVTYSGLAYPLADGTLTFGSTRGVSNEVAAPPATIHIEMGALLVVTDVGEIGG